MCPKLTKEGEETKDIHRLSKKVGGATISNATSESLDTLHSPTAPRPPLKLHRIKARGSINEQLEMVQSSPKTSNAERWPQITPTRLAPAKLSRSTAMNFNRPTIAAQITSLALDDKLPLAKNRMVSLQAPFDQPDVTLVGSRGRSNRLKANNQYYSNLQTNEDPQQGGAPKDLTSFMQQSFHYKPAKPMRYYNSVLSEEDKEALTTGRKNHNLKEWNARDLVRFHKSRLQLVPKSLEDRDAVIKVIQRDKENAERYLLRAGKQNSQTAQSTPEPRIPSAPEQQTSLVPIPSPQISPSLPVFSSKTSELAHSRNASDSDYFSRPLAQRPGRRPLSQPSSHHSRRTSHVRSPLANQLVFEPRPNVTFDSFLESHASGKGEAYRGAENAKKEDQPGSEEGSIELKPVGKPKNKLSNRISKMPSMPTLRSPNSSAKTYDARL